MQNNFSFVRSFKFLLWYIFKLHVVFFPDLYLKLQIDRRNKTHKIQIFLLNTLTQKYHYILTTVTPKGWSTWLLTKVTLFLPFRSEVSILSRLASAQYKRFTSKSTNNPLGHSATHKRSFKIKQQSTEQLYVICN